MKEKLIGQTGTSIKIVTGQIQKRLKKGNTQTKKGRDIRQPHNLGTLSAKDWRNVSLGLTVLSRLMREGFIMQDNEMLSGDKDISRVRRELVGYKDVIEDFARRINFYARDEYDIQSRMEQLKDYSEIAQAARDGVIIKQERRREKVNGEEKEVIYDTSMTHSEVINILMSYNRQANSLRYNRLDSYLGLGLGVAGMVGTMAKEKGAFDRENKKSGASLISFGATAVAGLKLIQGMSEEDERKQQWQLRGQQNRLTNELFDNEQVSSRAEDDAIARIKDIAMEEKKLINKIENKRLIFDVATDLAIAIISGMYINKNIRIKENGKIDGKTLASALVSLQASRGIAGNLMTAAHGIQNARKDEQEFRELCKKVQEILSQMEEKVYPLEGAKTSFESMQIRDFEGRFYPKKNYETGETQFSTKIKIPEFSMKRGDVVLLSGESGAGKSTFLRLLKRGDINNRNCITLDNGEQVDNLGNEYISFRPSINLGDETNVLFQLTGKSNVSDLDENERANLSKILKELNLDFPNLLEQLASKKFMEFSTGQQRRLALSKLFYRIDDGTSVIIVDEPVGNVEDKLIREQLEMIKKYAKEKNVMLLLTTHRLDLAQDLATKRYHINQEGVLEQIPIQREGTITPTEVKNVVNAQATGLTEINAMTHLLGQKVQETKEGQQAEVKE